MKLEPSSKKAIDEFLKNPKPDTKGVDDVHKDSDVDSSIFSQHHTLGTEDGQASPGPHIHDGRTSRQIPQASVVSLESRLTAIENSINITYNFFDWNATFGGPSVRTALYPDAMTVLNQSIDGSLPVAPNIDRVFIHLMADVDFVNHNDLRWGCQINGTNLPYSNYRIVGQPDAGETGRYLVYMIWDYPKASIPASVVTIAYFVGWTVSPGRQADIYSARVWYEWG